MSEEAQLERSMSRLLKLSVIISALLVSTGLGLSVFTEDQSCPTARLDPEWILFGDYFFQPSHIIFLGFLTLLLTPIIRTIFSIVVFSIQGEYIFMAITGTVLIVVVLGLLTGLH